MDNTTYVRADLLEQRLSETRTYYEDIDDDWDRAAKVEAYDTAIDAATCYPVNGGDIWTYAKDGMPNTMNSVLIARHGEKGSVIVEEGWHNDNGWHNGLRKLEDDETVFAWAYMPQPPEVE